jgi:hypothetical protein
MLMAASATGASAGDRRTGVGGSIGFAFPFGDIRDNPAATFSPSEEGISETINAELAVHRKIAVIVGFNSSKFAGHELENKRVTFWEAGLQFTNGNSERSVRPFFAICAGLGKIRTVFENVHNGQAITNFSADSGWHPGAKFCVGFRHAMSKHIDFRIAGEFRVIQIEGEDAELFEETTFAGNKTVVRSTELITGNVAMFNLGLGLMFVI